MITALKDDPNHISIHGGYKQNYPNPFNPTMSISFHFKQNSTVKLDIFNVLGQKVKELGLGRMNAGSYSQIIDMSRYASGVYLYRIEAIGSHGEQFISTKNMVLLKWEKK